MRKVSALIVATTLLTPVLNAWAEGEPAKKWGVKRSDPTPTTSTVSSRPIDPTTRPSTTLIGAVVSAKKCELNINEETSFPMSLIRDLTRDNQAPSFSVSGNVVKVTVPAVFKSCGDFVPYLEQDERSGNVFIGFKNKGTDGTFKNYKELGICLQGSKIMSDDKSSFDHSKLGNEDYASTVTELEFKFDKTKPEDIKKSIKVSALFPKSYGGSVGYGAVYGQDDVVGIEDSCKYTSEKIDTDVVYANKGVEALMEIYRTACQNGSAQRIAEARQALGNADALSDISDQIKSKLDTAYLKAVEADVKKIFDDMDNLERKAKDNPEMDEKSAKELGRKYAELAKKLDEIFINPAIMKLDELMKKYDAATDDDVRSKLSDEIKDLNLKIAEYSKRKNVNYIFELLEKFALTDSARQIYAYADKSKLYGSVYPGGKEDSRGKALTMEKASKQLELDVKKIESTLDDWTDVAAAGQGATWPIKKTERERSQAITRMNSRWNKFQQNENRQYAQYCSQGWTGAVKNPTQCRTFLNGVQRRRNSELRRRDRDLGYIGRQDNKLSKMGYAYNNYVISEERRREQEDSDYFGGSYSSFDDSFEDRFAQYSGPSMSTNFDPSMYMQYNNFGNGGGQYQLNSGFQQPQMYQNMPGQYQYQMMAPGMIIN